MRWTEIGSETCSVARALSIVGDRWTLLVLREAFLRARRFGDFQERLGAARNLLADRLQKLVEHGVRGYPLSKLKNDYQLSIVVMYLMFAGGVDQFDTSAERSEALFHEMYARLDAAMVDWKVGRLLKVLPLMVPFFKLNAWVRTTFSRKRE